MNRLIRPVLIAALLIGMIMRGWQARERFLYAHDNDLASWIVRDIVVDHHFRLIGQETSSGGIFIGPLFYYSLIPFYFVTGMDPVGSLAVSWIMGLSAIASLYFVMDRLYGTRPAGISALIYASSQLISQTEREVVPTTPVMLWSVWFYYAVNLIFQGRRSGLLLAAFLLGLVWHINLALILLSPIILLGLFINRSRFTPRDLAMPALLFLVMSVPLFTFEIRHDFIQTRSLLGTFTSLTPSSGFEVSFSSKLIHTVSYAAKNATRIFFIPRGQISQGFLPVTLMLAFILLLLFRKIPGYTGVVFILWMSLYLIFFSLLPINLSEYYLNGMNIFWIIIAALALGFARPRIFAPAVLCFLITFNLFSFLSSPVNASGYLQKRSLVGYIDADAYVHGYPCVSVSYITDPGYNLGYRYFFYLQGLKTAPVSSGAPVYTIVFPHSLVDRIDRSFGALGLVLPDYSRYDQESVDISCSGQDSNLTDPMFGFTR